MYIPQVMQLSRQHVVFFGFVLVQRSVGSDVEQVQDIDRYHPVCAFVCVISNVNSVAPKPHTATAVYGYEHEYEYE